MPSLNAQSNPCSLEFTPDYQELEVEIPETNVIDLEAARKFKNQIIPDTLEFHSLSDALREFPFSESIRNQITYALLFSGGSIPNPKQFSLVEPSIEPFEPIEPDPVSQATAA
jgi:hypothetical protein